MHHSLLTVLTVLEWSMTIKKKLVQWRHQGKSGGPRKVPDVVLHGYAEVEPGSPKKRRVTPEDARTMALQSSRKAGWRSRKKQFGV